MRVQSLVISEQTHLTYVAIFEGLIKINNMLELLVKQGTQNDCSNIKHAQIREAHSNGMIE